MQTSNSYHLMLLVARCAHRSPGGLPADFSSTTAGLSVPLPAMARPYVTAVPAPVHTAPCCCIACAAAHGLLQPTPLRPDDVSGVPSTATCPCASTSLTPTPNPLMKQTSGGRYAPAAVAHHQLLHSSALTNSSCLGSDQLQLPAAAPRTHPAAPSSAAAKPPTSSSASHNPSSPPTCCCSFVNSPPSSPMIPTAACTCLTAGQPPPAPPRRPPAPAACAGSCSSPPSACACC